MSTYIDIHILQTVPPSCINRDDSGSPKSCTYGGVRRARVSSQAWKRASRLEFNSHLDDSELGERTVHILERVVEHMKNTHPELGDAAVDAATDVIKKTGLKLTKPKGADEETLQRTGYLVFVARKQIENLSELAVQVAQGEKISTKQAKEAIDSSHSCDIALFGRMVADAPDLNVDATCQVSHALSVHGAATEFDYFTAVDDNSAEDNAGAGMIGTVEYVSSTLYRYATINADELAKSLGSAEAAVRTIDAFLRAFTVSMPTGKQNTFANRTLPELVAVQVREDLPTNLVGAFEEAIDKPEQRVTNAAIKLAQRANELGIAYDSSPVAAAHVAVGPAAAERAKEELRLAFGPQMSLNDLVSRVDEVVRERISE